MDKSYLAADVVARWRAVGAWGSGYVLLDRAAFAALVRCEHGGVLPVYAVAALLRCNPERIRSQVRKGHCRGFAFPAGHNWVSVSDARAVCGLEP